MSFNPMREHQHIEEFFADMRDTHGSGVAVKKTSYYPYLSRLLNTIGKQLKPNRENPGGRALACAFR